MPTALPVTRQSGRVAPEKRTPCPHPKCEEFGRTLYYQYREPGVAHVKMRRWEGWSVCPLHGPFRHPGGRSS